MNGMNGHIGSGVLPYQSESLSLCGIRMNQYGGWFYEGSEVSS